MWRIALKALFGWFAGWIGGFLQRRKLASETQRADKAEAKVGQDEQIIKAEKDRSDVDQKVLDAGAGAATRDMRDHWNEP